MLPPLLEANDTPGARKVAKNARAPVACVRDMLLGGRGARVMRPKTLSKPCILLLIRTFPDLSTNGPLVNESNFHLAYQAPSTLDICGGNHKGILIG